MAERLYNNWVNSYRENGIAKMKLLVSIIDRKLYQTLNQALNKIIFKASANERNASLRSPRLVEQKDDFSRNETNFRNCKGHLDMKQLPQTEYVDSGREQSNVFYKLNAIGKTRYETKRINEEVKKQREIQYCTFHPKVNSPISPTRDKSPEEMYDRLSRSNKKEKLKYFEAQKVARELQYCTFVPRVRKHSRSQSVQEEEPVYYRLTRKGDLREKLRKTKEFEQKGKELNGCTFSPRINTRKNISANLSVRQSMETCERLYLDHERKKQNQARSELEHEQQIQSACTFRPQVYSKNQDTNIQPESIPRYEMLYAKHQQNQQLLDQKRKELIAEEQRMHQLITSAKNSNKQQQGKRKSQIIQSSPSDSFSSPIINERNSPNGVKKGQSEEIQTFERLHMLYKKDKIKQEEIFQKMLQVF